MTLVDRELTGAAAPRLAIDLRVMPVPGSTWALYFDWLDDFYHRFLDRLDSLASGM